MAKRSIKTRILIAVLALICVVFLLISIIFNMTVTKYIRDSASSQLDFATNMVEGMQRKFGLIIEGEKRIFSSGESRQIFKTPDITNQPRNPFGAQAHVFPLSKDYNFINSDVPTIKIPEFEKIRAIAKTLQTENIPLGTAEQMYIKTSDGNYYLVSVPVHTTYEESYLIFFVDVTGITNFASNINVALFFILGVVGALAIGVAVLLSGTIVKPIQKLRGFAATIGQGNFIQNDFHFKDKELVELSDSLNQMSQQLDTYDKDQKIFFQNVSHELRTPLMSIKCYAEGIEYGVMEPQKSSKIIISETNRLTTMVDDLLYISRVDNLTKTEDIMEYDLRETFSNCVARQQSVADSNGIQFVYVFDEHPVLFSYDEKHLMRALTNLISNAIRYAKTTITLTCQIVNDAIRICVTDDGKGISVDDLPHIFERFYKGDDGKYGIGLAIVKSVVEMYGGTIYCQSTTGTTFTIELKANTSI